MANEDDRRLPGLIAAYENGEIDFHYLNKEIARVATRLVTLVRIRVIGREVGIEQILALYRQLDTVTKKLEVRKLKELEVFNAESLTTDTKGRRSQDWFTQSGKYFMSGVASNGLVAVLWQSETGMGASHRNIIDKYVKRKQLEAVIDGKISKPVTFETLITSKDLERVADLTLDEAFGEFLNLTKERRLPKSGLQIMVAGANQLEELQIEAFQFHILEHIKDHSSMHDGRGDKLIKFRSQLGEARGIVYGVSMNEPDFYSLSFS